MQTLAIVAATGILAGCGNNLTSWDERMMGRGGGFHYSSLTCTAPPLPGTTVHVMLADMGNRHMMGGTAPLGQRMMMRAVPAVVPAGRVSLVASNMGWRTHELVILPLAPGAASGERPVGPNGRIVETGSLGEASAGCAAGAGDGIPSGSAGWTTVTLPAGRYELVCNLRNHYANGMHTTLVVR